MRLTNPKKYAIQEILTLISPFLKHPKSWGRKHLINFEGDMINPCSDRYKVFYRSTVCVFCGLEGAFFRKEKDEESNSWHFNLYAIKGDEEILMTKDHIEPKSLGGKNNLINYQTLCQDCNSRKGNHKL